MDPDQFEKARAEFDARQAEINRIYQRKLSVIAKQQRISACFLVGYAVMLFTAIATGNPVLMGAAVICMLVVIGSLLLMTYQLTHTRYPGGKP